jgi:hypothetical protein
VRGYNFAIEFGELYHECKPDPPYKPGDLDFDGHNVNTADLLILLGAWGTCGGDCDGDCDTDTGDLLILLGNWGVY